MAVPGLFGSSDPYHLIAFKEDSDPRPPPEAQNDAVPSELVNAWDRSPSPCEANPSMSTVSGSTGRSSRFQNPCPELQEITLLVDTSTEFQDVQRAHVNFERKEDRDRSMSTFRSTMPSLHKLLKPSDWEKIGSSIRRFVERGSQDPQIQIKKLKRMTFQLPGQSGWMIAEEATLHLIQGTQKVWLYLKGFRPEKALGLLPLDGIQEGGMRERRRAGNPLTSDPGSDRSSTFN